MGVPALFRWLHKKYPKIITPVIEEQPYEVDGQVYPVDTTKENPNGEVENLYLDFNGIVHPCSHPENKPPPATESEMMMEIFKYTDRVVNMVRPRKLLMIAIDGVAPRAKMNQQRARRFRSARDAKEADEKKAEYQTLLKCQQQSRGDSDSVEEVVKKTWDSNVITPGTPFMDILALSVRYWVQWKLNTDPAWEQLKVVISDATVPGEGEHKVMEFVRSQRADPEYDPNTRHVMYGLDADLIMLGIATHEPHFRVLREDVEIRDAKSRGCHRCGQQGHYADSCTGKPKEKAGEHDEKSKTPELKPFVWLNVPILREYLGAELEVPGQPFRFDLERALDDWVFMCFFVGNDFLPHLPSLDIHEDGIDTLIAIWRDNIPSMGGYLTCDGEVDLRRAQLILQGLAKQEAAIFRRRRETEERREKNQKRREQEKEAREQREQRIGADHGSQSYKKGRIDDRPPVETPTNLIPASSLPVDYNMAINRGAVERANAFNKSAAAALKSQIMQKTQTASTPEEATGEKDAVVEQTPPSALGKRKADLLDDKDGTSTPGLATPIGKAETKKGDGANPDDPPPDTVKLWETGYEERYYEQKFHVAPDDHEFRQKVARSYVEGLAWVLLYYFQGCASWTWYYPYHYAPFAADFADLDKMDIQFHKGKPFRPFEQLMGVLPAASNHAIPPVFHPLMTDPESEIVDFYPEEFDLDLNGKKQSWKAIVLLPFIDEKRLLSAMGTKYPLLKPEEQARNEVGKDALYVADRHPLYEILAMEFYSKKKAKKDSKSQGGDQSDAIIKLPVREGGLAGMVEKNASYLPHMSLIGPEEDITLEPTVDDDRSMGVRYTMPVSKHVHKSMLLRGVHLPEKKLDNSDIAILKSKARFSGRSHGGAPLHHGNGHGNGHGYRGGRGGRGGNISYQADRPPPGVGQYDQPNPFAPYLDPKFGPPPGAGSSNGSWGRPNPPAGQNYGHRDDGYGGGQGGYGQRPYNGGSGGGGPGAGRSVSDSYYATGRNQGQGGYNSNSNGNGIGNSGSRGGSQSYRGSYDPRYGDGHGRR